MKKTLMFGLLMAALLTGGQGWAGDNDITGRVGVFGTLGYSLTAMEDINKDIDTMNRLFGGLVEIDNVTGGLTYSGGIHYGVNANLLVGIQVEQVLPESKNSLSYFGMPIGQFDFIVPATAVGGFVKGVLPLGDRVILTAGAGLDYLFSTLTVRANVTGEVPDEESATGSGIGVNLLAGGQVFLGSGVALGADIGYRIAKIGEMQDEDGSVLKDPNGVNYTVDYSGLILKGGLNIYF